MSHTQRALSALDRTTSEQETSDVVLDFSYYLVIAGGLAGLWWIRRLVHDL